MVTPPAVDADKKDCIAGDARSEWSCRHIARPLEFRMGMGFAQVAGRLIEALLLAAPGLLAGPH